MTREPAILSRHRAFLVDEGCSIDGYPFALKRQGDLIYTVAESAISRLVGNISVFKYVYSGRHE